VTNKKQNQQLQYSPIKSASSPILVVDSGGRYRLLAYRHTDQQTRSRSVFRPSQLPTSVSVPHPKPLPPARTLRCHGQGNEDIDHDLQARSWLRVSSVIPDKGQVGRYFTSKTYKYMMRSAGHNQIHSIRTTTSSGGDASLMGGPGRERAPQAKGPRGQRCPCS